MEKITISIAKDFSKTPGARYRTDGANSGQEFREVFLEKYFSENYDDTIIEIDLDGVDGYASSFLEETFGGLVRKYGRKTVLKKIIIQAEKLKFFKVQCYKYIENAQSHN